MRFKKMYIRVKNIYKIYFAAERTLWIKGYARGYR